MTANRAEWLRVERAVGLGERLYTRVEVSERTGVAPELSRRLWRALGFPDATDDERIFTVADADMLRVAAALVHDGAVAPEVAVQVTRVLGQSLARVADAQATSFGQGLFGDSAEVTTAVEALRPTLESFVVYAWRRHLAAALHSRLEVTATGGSDVDCVGFADLVGFTAASQQLSYPELAAMVERFEAVVYDIIAIHGGRVIKMIGDEVMYAVGDPLAAAHVALEIAEACDADPVIPSARVGVAQGETLRQEADLFGPTVNLASRLVNLANPGAVVISDELATSLADEPGLLVRNLRPRRLRGIGIVRIHVLRRSSVGR
ncbi:MAG: Adenylate cyclase [uncultured Acidimicrobiales bacterium]|uniref:Adenylate cyclase n=1 Tax=uncultured Acidimicrobiales bacterium TaxID=310071 RepID=A0A6J4H1E5_9ACTN|nr:MAG: Adenylate cyclase [uncultured Acidimicrobiales bacterium]